MDLLLKKISYPAGDINVPGILCLPRDRAACAPVIVFHGSDGFKPNHEMVARKLAKEGGFSFQWQTRKQKQRVASIHDSLGPVYTTAGAQGKANAQVRIQHYQIGILTLLYAALSILQSQHAGRVAQVSRLPGSLLYRSQ